MSGGNNERTGFSRREMMRLMMLLGGAASISSPLGRRAHAAAKAPDTINASFFVETKPTMIPKSEGWYEKMTGAKMNWSEVGSGAEVNTALAAGSIDLGFSLGSSPAAAGISQQIPYKIVAFVDNIGPAEDMIVRKEANIKKPEDFKGKKVATPFGSTSHFRLLGFLEQNKLSQSDVTVLDMNPNAEVAAWHRGDIDAVYVWSPAKAKMLADGGEAYPTSKELDAKGYVIADLIVARDDFLKKYPDTVAEILKAYGRGIEMWKSDPDQATDIVAKAAGVDKATARSNMEEYDFLPLKEQLTEKWLGEPGKPGRFAEILKRTADFLVEQKSIRSAPGLAAFQKGIDTGPLAKAVTG